MNINSVPTEYKMASPIYDLKLEFSQWSMLTLSNETGIHYDMVYILCHVTMKYPNLQCLCHLFYVIILEYLQILMSAA